MVTNNKILLVGLFLSEKNKHKIYRTAADQLAELLSKNNYSLIKVSHHTGKIKRFADTLITIFLKKKEYQIAIVPLYGGIASLFWAQSAIMLLKLLNKKVILIIHGGSIPQRLAYQPNRYLRVIDKADVVVCPSNFIVQTLEKYQRKAVLIENVLNINEYTFQNKNKFLPHLFWMRTFEDVYHPIMAVHVLHQLKKKYPTAKMIMAGHDRGLLPAVKQLATELNVIDSIVFPGYITNEEKNKIAQEYDIHICTNKIDNAPVSMIEMMCLGLPIVSVNSGGIPFLVTDNFNALLVDVDDVASMVDKISLIIDNPEIGKKLVQNGIATSSQYDESVVIKKWNFLLRN